MTREELENKMTVLLGGRAAEHLIFGHLSTGAADDLAKATDVARSMVMRYGMDERLGPVALESDRPGFVGAQNWGVHERDYSEETAREIDCAVRETVSRAFERAVAVLQARRRTLERGAADLMQRETLAEEALQELRAAAAAEAGA